MFITDVQDSSGTGFSLWVLVLAKTNPHRLKPVPLSKKSQRDLMQRFMLAMLMALSFVALPIVAQQQGNPKAAPAPAPKRDLSGLWHYEGTGASEPIAPDNLIPPMTPWAQARYDAEKPGYGPKRAPGGNDPILQCDPMGFPRVMFMYTPFEFVQAPGRVIQFFEHEHEYRSIWTDGRSLPKDADPNVVRIRDRSLGGRRHIRRGIRRLSRQHLARFHGLPAQRRHARHRALPPRGP